FVVQPKRSAHPTTNVAAANSRRARALLIPNAATELLRHRNRRLFAGKNGVDRILQTVLLHSALIHVVIDRAGVNDLPMAIEQEHVRCASRAVLTSAILRGIGHVRERKTLLLGTLLH